jgi:hypothetical protein
MNQICIKPWNELRVWENSATVCCWMKPYATFSPYTPTQWIWNSKSLNNIRSRMLSEGVEATCPNCPIYVGNLDRELINHNNQYPSAQWETIGRANVCTNSSQYPLVTEISVGDLCNSKCRMCWLRGKKRITDSRYSSEMLSLLHNICKESSYVTLSGGDIFAYDDDYIDRILNISPNAIYEAITNGQGLTLGRIIKYIHSGKIPRLKISLETVNPINYLKHCGRHHGDLLNKLIFLDGQHVVWYSSVITSWTLDDLPDLIEFAYHTNVKFVVIKPVVGNMLTTTGYGYANIFEDGYTPATHERALTIFADVERRATKYHILVDDLNLARKRLDQARERLLLKTKTM